MKRIAGPGGVIRVAKRIYVSNLTWRTSWQDLKDHFRQVGNGESLSLSNGTDQISARYVLACSAAAKVARKS